MFIEILFMNTILSNFHLR